MRNNPVKRSIDANLAGLRVTERSRTMIMNTVGEEKPMKKKVSVALVLAIVLALLTIGALAALLGSKEFVGNVLAPKAAINASDKWTQEEVQEILRIAEENGIALSDENLARLQSGDGYFKEELMRLFAKVDLGFYPSTWSLEDQAWYDQFLVDRKSVV